MKAANAANETHVFERDLVDENETERFGQGLGQILRPGDLVILESTSPVGTIELLPGRRSDLETHGGDEGLYVLQGTLHVHAPQNEGATWFELQEQDGFYVPQGAPHRYFNMSGAPVRFLFGIAPDYLP